MYLNGILNSWKETQLLVFQIRILFGIILKYIPKPNNVNRSNKNSKFRDVNKTYRVVF